MEFADAFPIWNQLTAKQQNRISHCILSRTAKKGTLLHHGTADCTGLLLIRSGQLRAYILSEEGREITLYRLFDLDLCLFSASCIMHSLQFEVIIEAEKETDFWMIPAAVYKELMTESAPLANYTNEIMASRFSEVMWLMEQILWKSFDQRLAAFLLEEAILEESSLLAITHETISKHLGTAREVVTRMLRYFQHEGIVKLNRGSIEILNQSKLYSICKL